MSETLHAISQVCIMTGVFTVMLGTGTSVPIGDVLKSVENRRIVGLSLLAANAPPGERQVAAPGAAMRNSLLGRVLQTSSAGSA